MDKYIRVKNCNCISDATIEIVEKSLNIKYGSNGTGKSTISEAIYAQANNETDRLKDFKPYAQLVNLEQSLSELVIEERQLQSFYATDLIKKLIYHVSDKINALKGKTGQLKGLFLQHEKKLDELIAQRQDDINQFFTIAGF